MAEKQDYISDGIEELEAPIPKWWKNTWLFLIVLCPTYMMFYHIGPDRGMEAEYDAAATRISLAKYAEIGELEPNAAAILTYMNKPNWVKLGKSIFKSKCANCHGRNAEGNVGPNLTDEKYTNIKEAADIAKVILKGANNNAMPAWEDKLQTNDVVMVSAYVASLRGTNASGGKAAEGFDIEPWPAPPAELPRAEAGETGSSASEGTSE